MRTLSDKTCRENQNIFIFKSCHLSDNVWHSQTTI